MTTTNLTEPVGVGTILFGTDDAVTSLTDALAARGIGDLLGEVLTSFGDMTRAAALQELGRVASGLLAADLSDVVLRAWRAHSAIVAAARRTASDPNSRELVEVATHEVTWAQEPYVELFVDGTRAATVHFTLALDLEVKALVVAIAGGRLTVVHSGSCEVRAALSAEGRTLAQRSGHLDLPVLLRLGDGIPLV